MHKIQQVPLGEAQSHVASLLQLAMDQVVEMVKVLCTRSKQQNGAPRKRNKGPSAESLAANAALAAWLDSKVHLSELGPRTDLKVNKTKHNKATCFQWLKQQYQHLVRLMQLNWTAPHCALVELMCTVKHFRCESPFTASHIVRQFESFASRLTAQIRALCDMWNPSFTTAGKEMIVPKFEAVFRALWELQAKSDDCPFWITCSEATLLRSSIRYLLIRHQEERAAFIQVIATALDQKAKDFCFHCPTNTLYRCQPRCDVFPYQDHPTHDLKAVTLYNALFYQWKERLPFWPAFFTLELFEPEVLSQPSSHAVSPQKPAEPPPSANKLDIATSILFFMPANPLHHTSEGETLKQLHRSFQDSNYKAQRKEALLQKLKYHLGVYRLFSLQSKRHYTTAHSILTDGQLFHLFEISLQNFPSWALQLLNQHFNTSFYSPLEFIQNSSLKLDLCPSLAMAPLPLGVNQLLKVCITPHRKQKQKGQSNTAAEAVAYSLDPPNVPLGLATTVLLQTEGEGKIPPLPPEFQPTEKGQHEKGKQAEVEQKQAEPPSKRRRRQQEEWKDWSGKIFWSSDYSPIVCEKSI